MFCRTLKLTLPVAALLIGLGCKDQQTSAALQPTGPASSPAEEPVPEPGPKSWPAVVAAGQTSLRDSADAKGKWQATLMRGEKLSLLDEGKAAGGAYHVRLSDGSEGFVSEDAVLSGDIEEVLTLEEKPLYVRPDEAAPRSGIVQVGTLLFVLRSKDGWHEVQLPKGRSGWMKVGDVAQDADELDAARSLFRYELLKDSKKEERRQEAEQILAEALSRHPQSRVLKARGLVAAGTEPGAASAPGPAREDAGAQ